MNLTVLLAQSTSSSAAGGAAAIVSSLVWLVVVVALMAALWKVFQKAGQPGWASLIPIYNTIVLLRVTGKSGWWVLGMIVPLLNLYVAIRLVFNLAGVFGRGMGFGWGLLLLSPIFLMILGFGSSRYVGPGGAAPTSITTGGGTIARAA